VPTRALSPLFLLAAVVVAWVAACSSGKHAEETGTAPGRGVYVPLAWQAARTITGHRVHVVEHQVACTRCHELTGTTMGPVSPARCSPCHQKEAAIEHASARARERFGQEAKSDCTLCHAFVPPKTEKGADAGAVHIAASDCLRCHRVTQGQVPAVVVHDKGSDCLQCHRPHEDEKAKSAPCSTCHHDVSLAHAAHGGESGCKDCHTHQHGKAADALGTCETCHAGHDPIVPASALFATGHKSCVDCHRPHEFAKALAKPCRSCHESVHVLGESAVPVHRQCASCHSPHDVRGSAKAACVGCHADLHPDHPKVAALGSGAGSCVGCHDPHPPPGSSHGLAKACSTCHAGAKSDVAFHSATECVKCHTPHDFVLDDGGKAVCHRCHETKFVAVAPNTGHQACAACHGGLPHKPTSGQGGCPTCHAKEHARVNPGHVICTNCHEPHRGTVIAACKNCHATEVRTAPPGHLECLKCHEEHSGALVHAPCASCHAKEAQTKHGKISADCSSCHKAHGPGGPISPPPCAKCHDTAKLPGLHSAGKHTECKDCHSGHEKPGAAMRAPCLVCHTDRRNHFPEAPNCASCHLFE
jgi:hypothetical protein